MEINKRNGLTIFINKDDFEWNIIVFCVGIKFNENQTDGRN